MPSTTTEKTKVLERARVSNRLGAGGEPLGETTAPPPGILERLPDEMREKLPDELVDELLAGARTEQEIVGPGGLLAQLTKRLVGNGAAEFALGELLARRNEQAAAEDAFRRAHERGFTPPRR